MKEVIAQMSTGKQNAHSHLLLLRMWPLNGTGGHGEGQGEWQARLQHVFSGEARTFRACPQLVDALLELLATGPQPEDEDGE
jgi:hypothetical protein